MSNFRTITVTDLTRFSEKSPERCLAGLSDDGTCIRPMPYLTIKECDRLNLAPGSRITGNFKPAKQRTGLHQEDCSYEKQSLTIGAKCTSAEFLYLLAGNRSKSIQDGFGLAKPPLDRQVPLTQKGRRSIITIRVEPSTLRLERFDGTKTKVTFVDGSGNTFRYVPITDVRFFDYAEKHASRTDLSRLNTWIGEQREIYIRVGLSRPWAKPGNSELTYWIQANGIYTFPKSPPHFDR